MIVDEREGAIGDPDDNVTKSFPLFGHIKISPALAALEGVDLFAARMDAFDSMLQSVVEHIAKHFSSRRRS